MTSDNDKILIDELGYYDEETWSKGLTREETLERQTRLIVFNYSKGLWNEFEYALKVLLPLLPNAVKKQFKPLKHNVSVEGIEEHYQLFCSIQDLLESDTNMIWRKKFVKTFD